jgi:hypothetical protein
VSHLANDSLKENIYEGIIDDLYNKYFQGVNELGDAYFSKTDTEIEEEAEKLTEEFITRNS